MASVKGNIILNGINTITGIIFPVITFPYAARILLPEGIGTVNFFNSIVNYIVLFTSLGIPMYAVKEIAKYRDEKEVRDKITIEIIILSIILCLIGYFIVCCLALYVPKIHHQSGLFYILSITILFNAIGVNWFYQGIEDFKFITIRAIIVRTLAAAALFIFVKSRSDILIYGIILVGSTVGNNIINFIYLRKYLNLKSFNFKNLNILKHIKPAIQIFVLNIIISLYVQLNTVMLGFILGDEAVGIYTGGVKITTIAQTMITSIGMVMISHCSGLLKRGDFDTYRQQMNKSLNLTLCLTTPLFIGALVLAQPIIIIFCGADFEESIQVFRIDSPLMVLSCLSNLIAMQILFPQDKVSIIIKCVSIGAVANIILNFILIPIYHSSGAALSANIVEVLVLSSLLITGRRYLPFKPSKIINIKYLLISLSMGLIVYFSIIKLPSYIDQLLIGIPIGVLYYIFILYLIKDEICLELINWSYLRVRKRK